MMQIEKFINTSKLLRARFLVLLVCVLLSFAAIKADDTTVISSSTSGGADAGQHPSLVFINRDVGFKLSLVGDQVHSFRTTDSGITWTDQGIIAPPGENFQGGPTVWYDAWTPGDSGSQVYFTAVNANGFNYDPLLAIYSVNSSGVLSYLRYRSLTRHNVNVVTRVTVAKGTDGMLQASYMKSPYYDGDEAGESNLIWSSKNSGADLFPGVGTTATFVNNSTYETGDDIMIRPLGNAKSIAFVWDISLNQILYSIYTPPTPGNFGTWSTRVVLATAIDSTSTRSAWAAVTNKTTKEVYFTFNTNVANSAGALKTYIFNGNTANLVITPKTDISVGKIYEVDLAIDNNTGNVYTIFTTDGNPRHFNAFISTNKMGGWQDLASTGNFDAYVADRNYAGISLNQSSSHIIGASLRNESESGKTYFVKLADLTAAPNVCDLPNTLNITRTDTLIDNNVNQSEQRHRSPSVVFTSATVGYIFNMAVDGDKKPFYKKTINGGLTWGARVNIDTTNDCDGVTVWYDKWTPGDVGNTIHIVYNHDGQNRLYYSSLNVSNDTLSIPVAITANSGTRGTNYLSGYSITKGYDGSLYASLANYYNANTIPMVKCNSACSSAGNWSATAIYPTTLVNTSTALNSEFKLAPVKNNKVLALYRDDAAHKITYSVYDSSSNTWSSTGTLETSTLEDNDYKNPWGLTIDRKNKNVYLCYNNKVDNSAGSIKTAIFNDTGFVAGSLRTVFGGESGQCDLAYNEHTGEVILLRNQILTPATNLSRLVAVKSQNQMQTWSGSKIVNLTNRDYRAVGMNFSSDKKIYVWYLDDANNDIYGNTILNIDTSRDPIFDKQGVGDWLHYN